MPTCSNWWAPSSRHHQSSARWDGWTLTKVGNGGQEWDREDHATLKVAGGEEVVDQTSVRGRWCRHDVQQVRELLQRQRVAKTLVRLGGHADQRLTQQVPDREAFRVVAGPDDRDVQKWSVTRVSRPSALIGVHGSL